MNWEQAWLNYRPNVLYSEKDICSNIYYNVESKILQSAIDELKIACNKMFEISSEVHSTSYKNESLEKGIHLIVTDQTKLQCSKELGKEGFHLYTKQDQVCIEALTDTGILYGVFELIRRWVTQGTVENIDIIEVPENPLRTINHWDNMDGSIERGYSGNSFFFEKGKIILGERIKDYARLMASIGINTVVINNVNVAGDAIELITPRYFDELKVINDIFNQYAIKLFLSLDYAAPIDIGGLDTSDPLDKDVIKWWEVKMQEVFEAIPELGGFLIKADSEGRPGPFTYNRTHADGANLLARAVKPYGAIIIWRCFVYNCQQDWRDYKTDRARSGYDNFMPLDGLFEENVILQIKNGPMDFQVREPVSPLIGALTKTNQIMEVQIAQEYTGQQRHVCYLIPMWKEALEFKTYCQEEKDTISDIVSGRTYNQTLCGMAAVSNTGNDLNWTGHDLAGANLYGYGRLSWNTNLSSEEIAKEWISQAFSTNEKVIQNISKILMSSWPAYEKYTSPLGIGWMVNPNHHYGPNVDGYEYDRWGTYHRADGKGIGVDRTSEGTGYIDQYFQENAKRFAAKETCPEELLLFFHRVPYTYQLSTGKTLIQHIYDTHFEGVEEVKEMIELWKELAHLVDTNKYQRTLKRFEHQLENSEEWRDRVNAYFYRKSLIIDEKSRKIY